MRQGPSPPFFALITRIWRAEVTFGWLVGAFSKPGHARCNPVGPSTVVHDLVARVCAREARVPWLAIQGHLRDHQ